MFASARNRGLLLIFTSFPSRPTTVSSRCILFQIRSIVNPTIPTTQKHHHGLKTLTSVFATPGFPSRFFRISKNILLHKNVPSPHRGLSQRALSARRHALHSTVLRSLEQQTKGGGGGLCAFSGCWELSTKLLAGFLQKAGSEPAG